MQKEANNLELKQTESLKDSSFSMGGIWRKLGNDVTKVAALTAGLVLGGEKFSPSRSFAAEPVSAKASADLLKDIKEVTSAWNNVKSESRELVEKAVNEFFGGKTAGFLEVSECTVATEGDKLSLSTELFLKKEFFEPAGIDIQDPLKLGEFDVSLDGLGRIEAGFSNNLDSNQEISKILEKALVGKNVILNDASAGELTGTIEKASFDGKSVSIEGPVKYKAGDLTVESTLTVTLPLSGEKPRIDLSLDESNAEEMTKAYLEKLKNSPEWKNALAAGEKLLKEEAGGALSAFKTLRDYIAIEDVKDSIDGDKKALLVTGEVYVMPGFFKLFHLDMQEKVNIGKLSLVIDERGRSTLSFNESLTPEEAVAKALAAALEGKKVTVVSIAEKPVEFTIQDTDYDGENIKIEGPVSYSAGKNHLAATLAIEYGLRSGKVNVDFAIDEASAKAMASAYLNDLIPNTPFGKIKVQPDPAGRGVIVEGAFNIQGMQGGISNVLVTLDGKVDTSNATVLLGSNVQMTFGYFMLSHVHGAYDLETKDLTLGGSLTVTGDTTGFLVRVEGESVFSLKDPTKLTTRGDLYILTLPAGYSEASLDIKNGRFETEMKIGNGNTKITGHAVIQAQVKGIPWKIEVDKADIELAGAKLSKSRLLINDSGMSATSFVEMLGGRASAEFSSDNALKNPRMSLRQALNISADLGKVGGLKIGKLKLKGDLDVTATKSGIEGTLSAKTKWGPVKIGVSARTLSDLSLSDLEKDLTRKVKKAAEDKLNQLAEAEKRVRDELAKAEAKTREEAAKREKEARERLAQLEKEAKDMAEKSGKKIEEKGKSTEKTVRKAGGKVSGEYKKRRKQIFGR